MATIEINPFDVKTVANAVKTLKKYRAEFEKKVDEFLRRLAEIAAQTARSSYAFGAIDGNDDVTVTIEPIENGYVVRADGEDVYFLEFGTGVAAGQGYDTSIIEPPVSIEPWSWAGKNSKTAQRGYWFYDGIKYTMTVPRMGMYNAAKEIQSQIKKVANEVFTS